MLKPQLPFYVQIVLFVGLWVVLKRWWFEPVLRVMRERAARSEGAIVEAKAVQAEAERLRLEHQATLERVKHETRREMQEIVRTAEFEQKRVITEAGADAKRMLTEARARIAEEVTAARRELHVEVRDIAGEIARKVLGRSV